MLKLSHFSLATAAMLILPLAAAIAEPSLAQRQGPVIQFPLLDNAVCRPVTSDTRNLRIPVFVRQEDTVVIGRQIYQSQFFTRSDNGKYTSLVCQIDSSEFDTLSLKMGRSDESANWNEQVTVNIYQSGSVVSTYQDVQAGQIIDSVLDLTNAQYSSPGDIAVEVVCEASSGSSLGSSYNCPFYFVEAELSPVGDYVSVFSN